LCLFFPPRLAVEGEAVGWGALRSRRASMAADRRKSAPVTASQCQRNGSGDKVVEAW